MKRDRAVTYSVLLGPVEFRPTIGWVRVRPPTVRAGRGHAQRVVLLGLALGFVWVILAVRNLQLGQQVPLSHAVLPAAEGGSVAVAVAVATPGDLRVSIPAVGTVTPMTTVTVKAQVSGVVQHISFREGQWVRRGEPLAQIDPRPFSAVVDAMRGNLQRDQSLLNDALIDWHRYEALAKLDSIAGQQLDSQRARVEQYRGIVESDEGQLAAALIDLDYSRIVSPTSGRLGLRRVDPGNYVTPRDARGIVTVNELQPISVLFKIPADAVTGVLRRIQAGATLKVDAYDRSKRNKLADGELVAVDNAVDAATGTVKVRARFDNTDGRLFPNQFVNVELREDAGRAQVFVPTTAVHQGTPQGTETSYVLVIEDGKRCRVRAITPGPRDGERTAVLAGLAAGERVVTEGGDELRDGSLVDIPGT